MSQINLLTNSELEELLNELHPQEKQVFCKVAAGVGWGKIRRMWGKGNSIEQCSWGTSCLADTFVKGF